MIKLNFVTILIAAILSGAGIAQGQVAHSGAIRNYGIPPIRIHPPAQADHSAVAADASNAFAFDLYAKLRGGNGGNDNLFFSPYSIASALTMAHLGARGPTADEMSTTLHLPAEVPAIEAGYQSLDAALMAAAQKEAFSLSIANALWGEKGHPFVPEYLDAVKKDFDANLMPMDFATQPEASRKKINDWVAEQTKNKITDLIAPGLIAADTRLVLTDAIYFKADWGSPFDRAKTEPGNFTLFGKQPVKTDLMHASAEYSYAEDDLCQMVRLPYAGNDLAMVVLLPKIVPPTGPSDRSPDPLRRAMENLQGALSQAYLDKLAGQSSMRSVNLTLPKWTATQSFQLGQTLMEMGMKQAFLPSADFTGIDGEQPLFISNVVHKAFVEVDEKGTTAAAASAVVMPHGIRPQALPPVKFTANHPFVYMIVDQHHNTILFAGRLCDPTPAQ